MIWPRHERVDVWCPGNEAPAVLDQDDVLDGEDVVPGFTYPVATLFALSLSGLDPPVSLPLICCAGGAPPSPHAI